MYVRIRPLGIADNTKDIIIHISKRDTIEKLKNDISKLIPIASDQQRLFFNGKQLIDDHRVIDYNVRLNDVIQLTKRLQKIENDANEIEKDDFLTEILTDAESKFYKIGDLVDVNFSNNGYWLEGCISKIFIKNCNDDNHVVNICEENALFFRVKGDKHAVPFECDVSFNEIRPVSFYKFKFDELESGMIVLANYNIETPKERGDWYDVKIKEISKTSIKGTLLLGCSGTPIENCPIKFVDEIMRIEKPTLLTERQPESQDFPKTTTLLRTYALVCKKCRDVKDRKCRECGCKICGGKNDSDKIILCDECDFGYHTTCLEPPLKNVPRDDWYCPDCKTDDSSIVKAGEKLKLSVKKTKMPCNSQNSSNKDWGKGMACEGMRKHCTIVPKDHYGAIPGIEVGTRWMWRFQVSEAGIHRHVVAGIHGRENDGAYSIALSGGYEDDIDNGDEFYYTGSGGRDLSGNKRSAPQSEDQQLTRMNKALALNCNAPFSEKGAQSKDWKKGKPVRVLRSYKGRKHSKYAPSLGYRYDGLYKVVKYYQETGKSGFKVWRYLLRRDDPQPAPWEKGGKELDVIYPDGYLEAQEMLAKNNDKSIGKSKKRKVIDYFMPSTSAKKPKLEDYKLESDVAKLITGDVNNEKLWVQCKDFLKDGQRKFLEKVQETFMCICCQDLALQPITTPCKHNFCKECLKRSFKTENYTCPYCRNLLGQNYDFNINENLNKILIILFPGYDKRI